MKTSETSVSNYISTFPEGVRDRLQQLRQLILQEAPQATEGFSYGMPAYKLYGKPLVYFAGYKKHIGLYTTPSGHAAFARELSGYKQGKGSVQFPVDEPLPLELIRSMVKFRVAEEEAKNPS